MIGSGDYVASTFDQPLTISPQQTASAGITVNFQLP
jgi:hypothetical protein